MQSVQLVEPRGEVPALRRHRRRSGTGPRTGWVATSAVYALFGRADAACEAVPCDRHRAAGRPRESGPAPVRAERRARSGTCRGEREVRHGAASNRRAVTRAMLRRPLRELRSSTSTSQVPGAGASTSKNEYGCGPRTARTCGRRERERRWDRRSASGCPLPVRHMAPSVARVLPRGSSTGTARALAGSPWPPPAEKGPPSSRGGATTRRLRHARASSSTSSRVFGAVNPARLTAESPAEEREAPCHGGLDNRATGRPHFLLHKRGNRDAFGPQTASLLGRFGAAFCSAAVNRISVWLAARPPATIAFSPRRNASPIAVCRRGETVAMACRSCAVVGRSEWIGSQSSTGRRLCEDAEHLSG